MPKSRSTKTNRKSKKKAASSSGKKSCNSNSTTQGSSKTVDNDSVALLGQPGEAASAAPVDPVGRNCQQYSGENSLSEVLSIEDNATFTSSYTSHSRTNPYVRLRNESWQGSGQGSHTRSGAPSPPLSPEYYRGSANDADRLDSHIHEIRQAKRAADRVKQEQFNDSLHHEVVKDYFSALLAKEFTQGQGIGFNQLWDSLPESYSAGDCEEIKDKVRSFTSLPIATLKAKSSWGITRIRESFGESFADRLESERKQRRQRATGQRNNPDHGPHRLFIEEGSGTGLRSTKRESAQVIDHCHQFDENNNDTVEKSPGTISEPLSGTSTESCGIRSTKTGPETPTAHQQPSAAEAVAAASSSSRHASAAAEAAAAAAVAVTSTSGSQSIQHGSPGAKLKHHEADEQQPTITPIRRYGGHVSYGSIDQQAQVGHPVANGAQNGYRSMDAYSNFESQVATMTRLTDRVESSVDMIKSGTGSDAAFQTSRGAWYGNKQEARNDVAAYEERRNSNRWADEYRQPFTYNPETLLHSNRDYENQSSSYARCASPPYNATISDSTIRAVPLSSPAKVDTAAPEETIQLFKNQRPTPSYGTELQDLSGRSGVNANNNNNLLGTTSRQTAEIMARAAGQGSDYRNLAYIQSRTNDSNSAHKLRAASTAASTPSQGSRNFTAALNKKIALDPTVNIHETLGSKSTPTQPKPESPTEANRSPDDPESHNANSQPGKKKKKKKKKKSGTGAEGAQAASEAEASVLSRVTPATTAAALSATGSGLGQQRGRLFSSQNNLLSTTHGRQMTQNSLDNIRQENINRGGTPKWPGATSGPSNNQKHPDMSPSFSANLPTANSNKLSNNPSEAFSPTTFHPNAMGQQGPAAMFQGVGNTASSNTAAQNRAQPKPVKQKKRTIKEFQKEKADKEKRQREMEQHSKERFGLDQQNYYATLGGRSRLTNLGLSGTNTMYGPRLEKNQNGDYINPFPDQSSSMQQVLQDSIVANPKGQAQMFNQAAGNDKSASSKKTKQADNQKQPQEKDLKSELAAVWEPWMGNLDDNSGKKPKKKRKGKGGNVPGKSPGNGKKGKDGRKASGTSQCDNDDATSTVSSALTSKPAINEDSDVIDEGEQKSQIDQYLEDTLEEQSKPLLSRESYTYEATRQPTPPPNLSISTNSSLNLSSTTTQKSSPKSSAVADCDHLSDSDVEEQSTFQPEEDDAPLVLKGPLRIDEKETTRRADDSGSGKAGSSKATTLPQDNSEEFQVVSTKSSRKKLQHNHTNTTTSLHHQKSLGPTMATTVVGGLNNSIPDKSSSTKSNNAPTSAQIVVGLGHSSVPQQPFLSSSLPKFSSVGQSSASQYLAPSSSASPATTTAPAQSSTAVLNNKQNFPPPGPPPGPQPTTTNNNPTPAQNAWSKQTPPPTATGATNAQAQPPQTPPANSWASKLRKAETTHATSASSSSPTSTTQQSSSKPQARQQQTTANNAAAATTASEKSRSTRVSESSTIANTATRKPASSVSSMGSHKPENPAKTAKNTEKEAAGVFKAPLPKPLPADDWHQTAAQKKSGGLSVKLPPRQQLQSGQSSADRKIGGSAVQTPRSVTSNASQSDLTSIATSIETSTTDDDNIHVFIDQSACQPTHFEHEEQNREDRNTAPPGTIYMAPITDNRSRENSQTRRSGNGDGGSNATFRPIYPANSQVKVLAKEDGEKLTRSYSNISTSCDTQKSFDTIVDANSINSIDSSDTTAATANAHTTSSNQSTSFQTYHQNGTYNALLKNDAQHPATGNTASNNANNVYPRNQQQDYLMDAETELALLHANDHPSARDRSSSTVPSVSPNALDQEVAAASASHEGRHTTQSGPPPGLESQDEAAEMEYGSRDPCRERSQSEIPRTWRTSSNCSPQIEEAMVVSQSLLPAVRRDEEVPSHYPGILAVEEALRVENHSDNEFALKFMMSDEDEMQLQAAIEHYSRVTTEQASRDSIVVPPLPQRPRIFTSRSLHRFLKQRAICPPKTSDAPETASFTTEISFLQTEFSRAAANAVRFTE